VEYPSFDAEYVGKLRDGDPEVQRHFTSHFGHLLDLKLRARLRTVALRDDARQETFLRVFATLHNPAKRQPENLGAFVNAVCNNVLLEMFRVQSRAIPMDDEGPEPADGRADPEAQAVKADRKRIVERVLGEMSGRDRDLLREVFLEERDKDDVCRRHEIDREYLRVVLHRARGRFRLAMEGLQQRAAAGGAR
jgi:RNA polymerase sigma-70 factor (ECF subfamily)